jgi:hypothetical protein
MRIASGWMNFMNWHCMTRRQSIGRESPEKKRFSADIVEIFGNILFSAAS